ncbi:phage tail tape measure protein [Hutsoniella sourekii]|uniref:phage tail tape measure protein n=1 Tax=Hutsoniella sourekii TaxID=87650 RepID=UPI00048274E7|nr:phage tail tape measure protein [Hutsoniella sourekii]
MALVEAGIHLTLKGEADYRAGLKGVADATRLMQTQNKLAMAQLGNNPGIVDKYKTSMGNLSKELQNSTKKTETLQKRQKELPKVQTELEKAIRQTNDAYKDSQKETDRLRHNYVQMRSALGSNHEETIKARDAWQSSKAETQALGKELKTLTKTYEENRDELTRMPQALASAELATQKLKNQAQALHKEYRDQGGRLADTAKKWTDWGDKVQGVGQKISNFGAHANKLSAPLIAGFTAATTLAGKFHSEIGSLLPLLAEGGEITQEHRQQVDQLSKASRSWAKDYGEHTSVINAGMAELIRNGYDANQVMGMMPNVLDASIASGEDFNAVMGTTSAVLSQFQLKGNSLNETLTNTQRVADALTYVANATSSGFTDLGEGMAYVGPIANTLNMSVEETASILGILSNSGIEASKGGTALRGALTRLLKPSKQNAQAMEQLGFSAEEYKNGLIDFPTILDRIAESTKGMTDEQKAALIAQAFGTEAQSAMNALVNEGGDAVRKYTREAENATGATKRMADQMKEMPEFKFKQMMAELRDLGIEVGTHVLPHVMNMVEGIGDLAQSFGKLSPGMQDFIIKAGLFGAALGPVASTLGSIVQVAGSAGKAVGGMIKWFGKITTPKGVIDTAENLGEVTGAAEAAGASATLFSSSWVGAAAVTLAAVAGIGYAIYREATKYDRAHQEAIAKTKGAYEEYFDYVTRGAKKVSEANKGISEAFVDGGETYKEAVERIKRETYDATRDLQNKWNGIFDKTDLGQAVNWQLKAMGVPIQNMQDTLKNFGITTKEELQGIQDNFTGFGLAIDKSLTDIGTAYQNQTKVTTDWAIGQKKMVKSVTDAVVAGLEEERQAKLQAMEDNKEFYTDYGAEISAVNKMYDDKIHAIRTNEATISGILADAAKNNKAINKEQFASIVKSYMDLSKAAGESLSDITDASTYLGQVMQQLTTEGSLAILEMDGTISPALANSIRQFGLTEDNARQLLQALKEVGLIEFEPKDLEVNVIGEEDLQRIIELFGGDFASLTDEQKTALVEAEGAKELSDLLFDYGIWKAEPPVEAKQAVVETDQALANFKPLLQTTDIWNNTEFLSKYADTDTNAPESQEKIASLISEYSGLPVDQVKQLMTMTNAGATKEELLAVVNEYRALMGLPPIELEADLDDEGVKEGIEQIGGAVNELDGRGVHITVNEDGTASVKGGLDSVSEAVLQADGGTVTVTVSAPGAETATYQLEEFELVQLGLVDKDVAVNASGPGVPETTENVRALRDVTEGLTDKSATVTTSAPTAQTDAQNVGAYADAANEVPGDKSSTVTTNILSTIANTLALKLWNAEASKVESKDGTITTTASGLPGNTTLVKNWNSAVNSSKDKSSTLTTRTPGLPGNTTKAKNWNSAVEAGRSKTTTLTTLTPGLPGNTGKAQAWNSAVAASYSKTSVLTTIYRKVYQSVGKHAEGGHIDAYKDGGNIQWGGMFASGGNVPRGYMGIVGEAGPELFHVTRSGVSITPLASGEKMRGIEGAIAEYMKNKNTPGGGQGVNINVEINGPVVKDEQDIKGLARAVGEEISKQMRREQITRKGDAMGFA